MLIFPLFIAAFMGVLCGLTLQRLVSGEKVNKWDLIMFPVTAGWIVCTAVLYICH